nr:immunoglobulin heavy chain junction region [Mus musculus]
CARGGYYGSSLPYWYFDVW